MRGEGEGEGGARREGPPVGAVVPQRGLVREVARAAAVGRLAHRRVVGRPVGVAHRGAVEHLHPHRRVRVHARSEGLVVLRLRPRAAQAAHVQQPVAHRGPLALEAARGVAIAVGEDVRGDDAAALDLVHDPCVVVAREQPPRVPHELGQLHAPPARVERRGERHLIHPAHGEGGRGVVRRRRPQAQRAAPQRRVPAAVRPRGLAVLVGHEQQREARLAGRGGLLATVRLRHALGGRRVHGLERLVVAHGEEAVRPTCRAKPVLPLRKREVGVVLVVCGEQAPEQHVHQHDERDKATAR